MNEAKKYFIFSLLVIGFVSGIFAFVLFNFNTDIDVLYENDDILEEFHDDLLYYLENEYPSYIKSNIKESIIDSFKNILR